MDGLDEMESEHFPLLPEDGEDGSFSDEYSDYSRENTECQIDVEQQKTSLRNITSSRKKNFFSALLDTTTRFQDLRDNTVGIIKGEYVVERKTLLHHAATSDSYDLLSRMSKQKSENIHTTS